jgi:hypothetical protein
VGQLRALISQTKQYADPQNPTAQPAYLIPDAQLQAYIAVNDGGLFGAAADALLALATNEALISKKIRTEDLQTDGPAVAGELRRMAETYRQRHNNDIEAAELVDSFEIVNYTPIPDPWVLR